MAFDRESPTMRSPWPTGYCCPMEKIRYTFAALSANTFKEYWVGNNKQGSGRGLVRDTSQKYAYVNESVFK